MDKKEDVLQGGSGWKEIGLLSMFVAISKII
jgi:hypothetical protein